MRRIWKQLAKNKEPTLKSYCLIYSKWGLNALELSCGKWRAAWPLLGHDSACALPAAINRRLREDKNFKPYPLLKKKALWIQAVFCSLISTHHWKKLEFNRLLILKLSYSVILFLQVQVLSHIKYSHCYQHLSWHAWEENAMYLSKDFVLSLW